MTISTNHPAFRRAVITETTSEAMYDVNADGTPDVTHNRINGRTLILAPLYKPAIPRAVFVKGAIFYHREVEEGVEVNVVLDLDKFTSASRSGITPEQEHRAEVEQALRTIAVCSVDVSVCGAMDLNPGDVL